MKCNFHVGQKVVCIDDVFVHGWRQPGYEPSLPVRGVTYTIRNIVIFGYAGGRIPLPGLLLEEINNPVVIFGNGEVAETPFPYMRFRPLTERKTDTGMAILKKLLQPKHERV